MVCTSSQSMEGVVMDPKQCQLVNNQNYNFQPNNNLPTHYHPGLRNHENFSYGNPNNALQALLGFPQLLVEKKSSLENLLSTFIVKTRGRFNKDEAYLDNIETHCANMSTSIKFLEVQVGQLASELKTQIKGKFSCDTEHNPREQCNAITLRSRKKVELPKPRELQSEKIEEKAAVKKEPPKAAPRTNSISFSDNPPVITPPLPFLHRFQKKKMNEQFSTFLEMFKKLYIKIPFMEALEKMMNYIKFMKEVMSKKKRLEDYETEKLIEECSGIL